MKSAPEGLYSANSYNTVKPCMYMCLSEDLTAKHKGVLALDHPPRSRNPRLRKAGRKFPLGKVSWE